MTELLEFSNVDRRQLAFLLSGVIVGSAVVFLSLNAGNVNGNQAAQELAQTLEQSSGQNLEVINVEKRNGLYRVQMRSQNDQLLTYYMTQNGQLVTQEGSMTNFNQLRQRVAAQSQFTSCMTDRNVLMFGNQSQRATAAQIQLLGGPNMVSGIYADVNDEQTLQQARQAGIQRTPAFVYNGSIQQGIQTVPQLENFTGCEYPLN